MKREKGDWVRGAHSEFPPFLPGSDDPVHECASDLVRHLFAFLGGRDAMDRRCRRVRHNKNGFKQRGAKKENNNGMSEKTRFKE